MIYKCSKCNEVIETDASHWADSEYYQRIFKHEATHK